MSNKKKEVEMMPYGLDLSEGMISSSPVLVCSQAVC